MPKKSFRKPSNFKSYPKSESREADEIEVVKLTEIYDEDPAQEEMPQKPKFGAEYAKPRPIDEVEEVAIPLTVRSDQSGDKKFGKEFNKAEILSEEELLEEEELLRDHARKEAELQDEAEDSWSEKEVVSFQLPTWFKVLLAMSFIALTLAGIWMVKERLEGSGEAKMKMALAQEVIQNEAEAEEAGRVLQEKIRQAVEGFLTAQSPGERLAFSRHPKRVEPLMREYYQREEMRHLFKGAEIKIKFMDEAPQVKDPRHKHYFFLVEVTSEDYEKKLLVEITESGRPLIDWEGYVYYRPMSWDDYLDLKPAEPIVFRCLVRANQYYLMPYEDEEKYFALELRDTKSKRGGLAYIRRDHPKFGLLKEVEESARSKRPFPFILEIEMPLPEQGTQSILVKDILSVGGVYMEPTLEG